MRMALVDPAGIVVGLLDWDTAATFTPQPGYVLRPAGDAHVGDTGVIPNSALTSPILPAVVNPSALNFALGISATEIVGVNLTVPDGLTRLLLNATGYLAVLPSASAIATLQVNLGAVNGPGCSTYMTSGNYDTVPAGLATLAEGLTPGSTLRLSAYAFSSTALNASVYNTVSLTATLLWLR